MQLYTFAVATSKHECEVVYLFLLFTLTARRWTVSHQLPTSPAARPSVYLPRRARYIFCYTESRRSAERCSPELLGRELPISKRSPASEPAPECRIPSNARSVHSSPMRYQLCAARDSPPSRPDCGLTHCRIRRSRIPVAARASARPVLYTSAK